ncbi:hypothetical protein KEJ32_05480 [Candidatus Bathyarchaeota archaeon]|nr:hypothetical protein [Candidatus Bathyarchaeota archaeon]
MARKKRDELEELKKQIVEAHKKRDDKKKSELIKKYRELLKKHYNLQKERFENIIEAYRYLAALDYRISQSRFYGIAEKLKREDGYIYAEDLERWAEQTLDIKIEELAKDYHEEKKREELRKLKAEADLYELKVKKMAGELIEASIVKDLLAVRAAEFLEGLKSIIEAKAEDLAYINDANEIKDLLMNEIKELLRRYVRKPKIKTDELDE